MPESRNQRRVAQRGRWASFRVAELMIAMLLALPLAAQADKARMIELLQQGRHAEALPELKQLAEAGDSKAMNTIGEMYYNGTGVPQSYEESMNWWLRSMNARDADAFVNIGVLYRDGKGVARNLEVAYGVFLIVHMQGMGNDNTQMRNGSNLSKAIAAMTQEQVEAALCNSAEYVVAYVSSRGQAEKSKSKGTPMRDREWWHEGEIPEFACQ